MQDNNNELLQKSLILNALRNAKDTISEIYTNQETGERDDRFGNNEMLYNIYHQINEVCIELAKDERFWHNK